MVSHEDHDEVSHIVLPDGDEILVDEHGEVLDWPDHIVNHLEFLQEEHARAAAMQKAWEIRRQTLSRAVGAELSKVGTSFYAGRGLRTKWVSPRDAKHVYKPTLTMALAMKAITLEQLDEMLERASRELEQIPLVVLDEMVTAGTLNVETYAALVTTTPRAGYARTTAIDQEEPGEARKRRKQFEDGRV